MLVNCPNIIRRHVHCRFTQFLELRFRVAWGNIERLFLIGIEQQFDPFNLLFQGSIELIAPLKGIRVRVLDR